VALPLKTIENIRQVRGKNALVDTWPKGGSTKEAHQGWSPRLTSKKGGPQGEPAECKLRPLGKKCICRISRLQAFPMVPYNEIRVCKKKQKQKKTLPAGFSRSKQQCDFPFDRELSKERIFLSQHICFSL